MRKVKVGNFEIDAPILTILRKLKRELTNGKLREIDENSGDWIKLTCPSHSNGKENNPSCGVYRGEDKDIEYGMCHCFTCGFSGSLFHFVGECFDADDEYGKEWLLNNFGLTYCSDDIDLPPLEENQNTANFGVDFSEFTNLQSFHPYMRERKLKESVCKQFEVKYDPSSQCLVFPVYDENNILALFTRRSVNTKMFLVDKDKEKPVYLYYYIKQLGLKEVTVVESQINALTLWGWGIPAVALFGTGTPHQYKILNESGITHFYLCFDGDPAGVRATKKFIENINKSAFVDVIEMTTGKDVNNLCEEEFNALKIVDGNDWYYSHK